MRQVWLFVAASSLLLGCGSVTTSTIVINPDAPAGSTRSIVVTKIDPVFYTGETIILAKDKDNKETHYNENHTDIGMVTNIFTALAGFMMGKL